MGKEDDAFTYGRWFPQWRMPTDWLDRLAVITDHDIDPETMNGLLVELMDDYQNDGARYAFVIDPAWHVGETITLYPFEYEYV